MTFALRDAHEPRAAWPGASMRSVACLVTAGSGDLEAVRQAGELAAGERLTLIDAHARGAEDRARMTAAWRIATAHGLDPEIRVVHAGPTAPTVLMVAAAHDLLVVAAEPLHLGELARTAVRQAPVPVLLARPLREGARVTDRLLVATDGSPEAQAALTIANEIAHRRGSALSAVAPGRDAQGLTLVDLTRGPGPDHVGTALADGGADVADVIAAAARLRDATLVVIGSRGLSGVAGLASVSAHVAQRTECSVLVVRPRI